MRSVRQTVERRFESYSGSRFFGDESRVCCGCGAGSPSRPSLFTHHSPSHQSSHPFCPHLIPSAPTSSLLPPPHPFCPHLIPSALTSSLLPPPHPFCPHLIPSAPTSSLLPPNAQTAYATEFPRILVVEAWIGSMKWTFLVQVVEISFPVSRDY